MVLFLLVVISHMATISDGVSGSWCQLPSVMVLSSDFPSSCRKDWTSSEHGDLRAPKGKLEAVRSLKFSLQKSFNIIMPHSIYWPKQNTRSAQVYKGGKIYSTFWWEEWQSHVAKEHEKRCCSHLWNNLPHKIKVTTWSGQDKTYGSGEIKI